MNIENSNLICNTLDNGIILIDKDFNVHFWNRWLERRTNITSEEIIGKNIIDFFPKIEVLRLKRKINTSLKLNIATYYNTNINKYLIDIKLNKIANKVFDNMQQSVTITPYDVDKQMVVMYIYDNTLLFESNYNLQKKNKEIEESKNEIHLLLDATSEAMFLYENNKCKHLNGKALEIFDYTNEDELKNTPIEDLIHSDYKNLYHKDISETIEVKMIKKSGKSFHALIQIKNTKSNNTNLKVITVLDITELKAKDKILSEQSKMAALGEMLANIAHQWRQPLNAISTISSGLQFQKDINVLTDSVFSKGINDVLDITKHLSQTINDFKNFMRKDKIQSKFCIEENIIKTLSMLDGMLKIKDIEIVTTSADEKIEIVNFPNELTQALINVLNNAQEAVNQKEDGKKFIFINIYKEDSFACIEIKDTGNGIPESIIDRIFEPYFTTKHQDQGTGLGLYMTHQLIEMSMKGSILVKNEDFYYNHNEYRGACFTIKLPLSD